MPISDMRRSMIAHKRLLSLCTSWYRRSSLALPRLRTLLPHCTAWIVMQATRSARKRRRCIAPRPHAMTLDSKRSNSSLSVRKIHPRECALQHLRRMRGFRCHTASQARGYVCSASIPCKNSSRNSRRFRNPSSAFTTFTTFTTFTYTS